MVILFLILHILIVIGIPLFYSFRLWRSSLPSRGLWVATMAEAIIIVALVLLIGRWDIVGHYTRFVLAGVLVGSIMRSVWRHAFRPLPPDSSAETSAYVRWSKGFSLIFLGAALVYVVAGAMPPTATQELALPLRGGQFMVAQGGGNTILNHHANHSEQRYAVDITAVNSAGFRAKGALPKDLNRYTIYGASVISPCEGEVIETRNGLPDLPPPRADDKNPAGNQVTLGCGGIDLVLAHLRQDSIRVVAGDRLTVGAVIGDVGNSGNTTEPHLHIHAFDTATGKAVPISFDGRWPVRNRLWFK